jgi:CO/xanthine dehydrogenase Mo-binding subunit
VPIGGTVFGRIVIGVVGLAIGNAIFAACCARLRHLPIRPRAVLQALREGDVHR